MHQQARITAASICREFGGALLDEPLHGHPSAVHGADAARLAGDSLAVNRLTDFGDDAPHLRGEFSVLTPTVDRGPIYLQLVGYLILRKFVFSNEMSGLFFCRRPLERL
jgi:hypothetical protein